MTIILDTELEEGVRRAANANNVSESFVIQEAVRRFIEDREDYLAGISALSQMKYTISLDEMERRAELAD
jgi:predicted transcriptional regulator